MSLWATLGLAAAPVLGEPMDGAAPGRLEDVVVSATRSEAGLSLVFKPTPAPLMTGIVLEGASPVSLNILVLSQPTTGPVPLNHSVSLSS